MKKRLLFCCALMVATLSSYAYQLGDYVFTVDAKYKVVGDNLLTNGDFSSNFEGWKDASGSELNPDFWSLQIGASETGGNVVQSNDGSADQTGNYMFQSVPYEPGKTYIISFKVKGVDPLTSSITFGTSNYLDVYVNTDGSLTKEGDGFVQIATTSGVTGDWTSYSYAFTDKVEGGSNGFIVIGFGQLTPGTQVSDVEIREASQVFDTRISDKEFAYSEALLGVEAFVNGREEFQGTLAGLKEYFASPEMEDPAAAQDVMNSFFQAQNDFLNANSYDVSAYIDSKTIWNTKVQKAGGGKQYGDWYLDGDERWFHDTDATHIRHYIQGSYNLSAGTAKIVKMLPPGKYFFSCESKGHRMAGSSKTLGYEPDYTYVVEGAAVFIGNDSVKFNLDQRNFERHFVVADVAEGETLNAGFWHPATSVDNKLGGTVYMQAPVLRILGDNSEGQMESYIVNYATLKDIETQANALRVMLDSAVTVKAKAEFPWGKDALQESITYYEGTYSSLSVIQPGDELFAEAADSLMQSMRLVRSAIQAYYSLNEPYTLLKEQVAIAQGELDNPANANAQASARQALKEGVDMANALIAGVTSEPQTDDFNSAIENLKELTATFKLAVASYSNPLEVEIVNADFASYSGGNSSTFSATGWDVINASGNGKFAYGTSEDFEYGTRISSWRGYTGNAMNKISQSVTLTHKGAYEFVCQVYANNENGTRDGNMTNEIKSGIFAYAKLAESADSIGAVDARTPYTYQATLGYGDLVPKWVVITYNKLTEGEEVVEIGLDALNLHNGFANRYGFGSDRVRYCGPHASYITDVKAALEAQVNKLEGLWNSASDDLKASEEGIAMQEAIESAKLVLAGTIEQVPGVGNSSVAEDAVAGAQSQLARNLKRVIAEFEPVVTGIGGVKTDAPVKVQNGVFSISGVKVAQSAENLPKGLYIVDGKKVIVK